MTDTGYALEPGTCIAEFRIDRVLGSGGFGVTYLARDESLAVWRAVKEYLPRDWAMRRQDGQIRPHTNSDAAGYAWGLDRFLVEARTLAQFDHRNIVGVYRIVETNGTAYMVQEYVEGLTLAEHLKANGPMSEPQVRRLLEGLGSGLSEVHRAEMMHRDIKPGNVVIRPDGTPVLIDFGSARHAMGHHSRSVTSVLTPGYAPLEQYSNHSRQGPWTDIYALGAVAYVALSGQAPDDATERALDDRLQPLQDAAPGPVSSELAEAVHAALRLDGRTRPQTLAAWQARLDQPLSGSTAAVERKRRPASAATATSRVGSGSGNNADRTGDLVPGQNVQWFVAAGLAGMALLAVALVILFIPSRSDPPRMTSRAVAGQAVAIPTADPSATAAPTTRGDRSVPESPPRAVSRVAPPPAKPPARTRRTTPTPSTSAHQQVSTKPPVAVERAAEPPPAPSPADPPSPIRAEGDTPRPERLRHEPPNYPPAARKAGIEGTVVFDVQVSGTGEVTGIDVLRSVHPLLDEAARTAARQWAYAPTLQNGMAVPVVLTETVEFDLPERLRGTGAGPPAAPAAATVDPIRVGGSVGRPDRIRDMVPTYPPGARKDKLEGMVILEAEISGTGEVIDVTVLRSVHPLLDEAAVAAARQWVYAPTLKNGVAVPVVITETVNFVFEGPRR